MTLAVGDKVKVTKSPPGRPLLGVEGSVLAVGGAFGYTVKFDRPVAGVDTYPFLPSELEKIEPEPPRPLGLQAGDKVVNLKTGREGLVLKGPISGELKVYDQKPPIKTAVPAQALEEYEFHYPGTYDVWRRVTEKKKAQPW